MNITKQQKDLMRHTIGLPAGEPNRNWFGTSEGCPDAVEFDKLVEGGLAVKAAAPSWSGDDVIYSLNEDGKYIAEH